MYRKVSYSYCLALIHALPVYALKTGQEMRLRKCLIYERIFYSVVKLRIGPATSSL